MERSRRWKDLSTSQRATILTLGSVEIALTTVAAVDLCRRPKELLRGPKALWWPAIFVQPIGPIAYLRLARRPPATGR
jgi:Phospholipase_D-nuclease N-terminal